MLRGGFNRLSGSSSDVSCGPLFSALCEHATAAKRRRAEKEEDLVSLGSDDDDDGDDSEGEYEATTTGGEKAKSKRTAEAWGRERPLDASTLLATFPSSRSFFTSAAAVAGGRVGAQLNGKRAK